MHFRNHPVGVMWLRTSTVVCHILMLEFITVCKWSYRKVMFSWVCVILFIGGCILRTAGSIWDITPSPEYTQSMGGHAIDILQECIIVPKTIADFIQAQWSVILSTGGSVHCFRWDVHGFQGCACLGGVHGCAPSLFSQVVIPSPLPIIHYLIV